VTTGIRSDAALSVDAANDPATQFWGRARPTAPGTVAEIVLVPGRVKAATVTITSAPETGPVTGSAVLQVGNRTVDTTFTWIDGCNWVVNLTRNSASGKPRARTKIDLDKVSGAITAENCQRSLDFTLHGYRIGDKKGKIKLAVTRGSFEGTRTFSTLTVGETQYANATVTVSSSRRYAQLSGTVQTNLGRFTADSKITNVKGVYTQSLKLTGADLKIEKGGVRFDDFAYTTSATYSPDSCASFTNSFDGSFYMKNKSYKINDARMTLDCGKVTVFKFKITVSHKEPATGVVKQGILALAWTNKAGTAQDLLDPSLGQTGGRIGTIAYKQGIFGYVDLSQTRRFSRKYKGRTFSRGVTMGVVFGVAIYVPQDRSAWNAMIGAGGYFDADRVSGSFGCVYEHSDSDDFRCAGQLRLNPSWAGVYRAGWNDI
jgi:hypothetical protein